MSRLTLAGVGWVPDPPAGNRLLFHWPEDAAGGAGRLQPGTVVLERASLDEERRVGPPGSGPAGTIAPQLWTNHGDVSLAGVTPIVYRIAGPIQAARFVYHGQPTVIMASAGATICEVRGVSDGDWVWLAAATIDTLIVLTNSCTLGFLATANLYSPPALRWRTIAEINVAATAGSTLPQVVARYPAAPTMDAGKWSEFLELWDQAWAEAPGAPGADGGPNAWQALELVLAARWEHSVLAGLGFVDGGGHAAPELDRVDQPALLTSAQPVAYRILDRDGQLDASNVVCIPAVDAADLVQPDTPAISAGAVRLGTSGVIRASWDLGWHSGDPGTTAVEVQEVVQAVGSNPQVADYQAQGRTAEDPPGSGILHREVDVDSALVTVAAEERGLDGFDRVSTWSPSTGPLSLPIDHHPQAPQFESATHDGTNATLNQPPPDAWSPDAIVASTGGRVQILRKVGSPAAVTVNINLALKLAGGAFAVRTADPAPPNPSLFVGGSIRISAARGSVTAVAWPVLVFELPYAAENPTPAILTPAKATLTQAITDPVLWQQVANLTAAGLPPAVTFPDPLPPPSSASLIEYRARVSFAGLLGPLGPAVQAIRLPDTPTQPPPFTVTVLGVDFYQRTLVQLELTSPRSDRLEVWWADGEVSDADFPRAATPGDTVARRAEEDRILWETLSLPIPNQVDRAVTIGVQGVNDADGRGPFSTVQFTLPKP